MQQINADNILDLDKFQMKPIGSSAIQPAHFPGLGDQSFRRNGVTYTNLATKSAVINQLEDALVEREGVLVDALDGMPYLAVETEKEGQEYIQRFTTLELPHRIGSGVFALSQKGSVWDFPDQLLEKMEEVGPYNAVAFFDPISALFGCFLSHYSNIPSTWSKFTGAVTGGVMGIASEQVIASAITRDPMGANGDEVGVLMEKGRVSHIGMGNVIHLSNDVDCERVELNLYLNKARLKFYDKEIQNLLINIYKYASLKCMSNGFDFRNRCFIKPITEVEFEEKKLAKAIQSSLNKCRKKRLISESSQLRVLNIAGIK